MGILHANPNGSHWIVRSLLPLTYARSRAAQSSIDESVRLDPRVVSPGCERCSAQVWRQGSSPMKQKTGATSSALSSNLALLTLRFTE